MARAAENAHVYESSMDAQRRAGSAGTEPGKRTGGSRRRRQGRWQAWRGAQQQRHAPARHVRVIAGAHGETAALYIHSRLTENAQGRQGAATPRRKRAALR